MSRITYTRSPSCCCEWSCEPWECWPEIKRYKCLWCCRTRGFSLKNNVTLQTTTLLPFLTRGKNDCVLTSIILLIIYLAVPWTLLKSLTYRLKCLVAQFTDVTTFLINQQFNFDKFQRSTFPWASWITLINSTIFITGAVGAFKDMICTYNNLLDLPTTCKEAQSQLDSLQKTPFHNQLMELFGWPYWIRPHDGVVSAIKFRLKQNPSAGLGRTGRVLWVEKALPCNVHINLFWIASKHIIWWTNNLMWIYQYISSQLAITPLFCILKSILSILLQQPLALRCSNFSRTKGPAWLLTIHSPK